MTIRLRITLLVIFTFIAISLIGGYAVFQSHHGQQEVRKVTEGVVPSTLASSDLVAQLKEVQLSATGIVAEPNLQIAEQNNDKLSAKKTILEKALDVQLAQADSAAQRGLVEQAKESLELYFGAIDDTVKLKLAGKEEIAKASLFGTVVQYQLELEQIVDTLRIEKNRSKDEAIAALNQNLSTTTTAIFVVTTLAILLLTVIGILLYRQITGPISRMQQMMSEIAASQDFTRRVPVGRMDEVGHSIVAFNGMLEKIQVASAQVRQKTADIQTMLQTIPQGILTIVAGNKVHPEYSAYLETLLERSDIAGADVMDLVFSETNLGADALSQIETVGGTCIGEDVMNFAFNEHLMVGEIEKHMADGRIKIFDLNWSPIVDESDTIVRLMLCIRDVTELRQLAAEANEQKRELEIIGEILAVAPQKFDAFVASSRQFIDENAHVIHQNTEATAFAIAKLFRNMHTIKGNSRTYGLLHLANVVHEAEQYYEALRQPTAEVAWDKARLQRELDEVRTTLERYAHINDVTLGRKRVGEVSTGAGHMLIDRKHILDSLQRLETVNTANLHELLAARNDVRKTLRLLGTERLDEVLADVVASVPTLAISLEKSVPSVTIDDGGHAIHKHVSGLIKNAFMHLIRNAVDHGIELPAARRENGKPESGAISVQLQVSEDAMQLVLKDDGRGLALDVIRKIAIEKGLSPADVMLDDHAAAHMILRPGFSTAQQVTDISGRGVGMDAVVAFLAQEGGTIGIEFEDAAVGAAFRQFRTVITLPAEFAVEIDAKDDPLAHLSSAAVRSNSTHSDSATDFDNGSSLVA
ncbi:Hpt domain-containing protein [uncultured Oxalicibacterium sp.]|uniref:Hpt domain-containing protein n=1 Tax=uncultured Oxalicibacterium sp. TaxID=1168540 RepID=UPI0025CD4E07|nr:Hpt domain-containing protein [uncultured Oxalicibacterium sp.]